MRQKPKPPPSIEYNPAIPPERAHGYKHVRWVENASRGLRLVGFADEIAKQEDRPRQIDHKGWYTDPDPYVGSEVYRGVVYRIPGRHGRTMYVYGYADPNNDDAALLCFDPEHDKMHAALRADRFAEIFAETEREYQEAWQAGRRCEDLADEIAETRKRALAIGSERRAARGVVEPSRFATICATLRTEVFTLYRLIQKMRKERIDLIDTFGKRPGFAE